MARPVVRFDVRAQFLRDASRRRCAGGAAPRAPRRAPSRCRRARAGWSGRRARCRGRKRSISADLLVDAVGADHRLRPAGGVAASRPDSPSPPARRRAGWSAGSRSCGRRSRGLARGGRAPCRRPRTGGTPGCACTVTGSPVEPEVLVSPIGWWPLGTCAGEEIGARLLQMASLQHRQGGEAVDRGRDRPRSGRRCAAGPRSAGECRERCEARGGRAARPAPPRARYGRSHSRRLETGHQRGELGRVADEQRRPDDALDVARAAASERSRLRFPESQHRTAGGHVVAAAGRNSTASMPGGSSWVNSTRSGKV